jgi:hypothetical protein
MVRKAFVSVLLVLAGLAQAQQGADYLVICADNLTSSVQPLVVWKQATGLRTRVVPLSQVGYDTTSIKNYVRSAYTTWSPRPEYVLIVGSPSMVPARLYYNHGSAYVSTDNVYADMNGDVLADLAVGRFPATNTTQLDVMVAKTLGYEQHPDLTDSLWMRRMTTIIREGQDADDTIYWDNIHRAATQAQAAGYVRIDSLSYLRGDDWQDVVASANAGTGIILYRGTANGSWYAPFDIRPSQIAATNKLSIVTSITCATMTLVPGEEMLGDSWMRTGTTENLRGAVAFFGNTHAASNVASVRGAVCRGFYDGLFNENVWKLGKTAIRARLQLHNEYPTYTSDYRGFGPWHLDRNP